jgi:hypothetical protein
MIECPGWAAKKVNSQAQKGGMIGIESHICREPRPARGRSPFRGQRSRGVHFDVKGREANRSIVRGEKREKCQEAPQRLKSGVLECARKDAENSTQKAPFSAALSQGLCADKLKRYVSPEPGGRPTKVN